MAAPPAQGKAEDKLLQQLKKWRDDLVNLSRTNRLLYFRHTKTTSLEIEAPASDLIRERLKGSASSNFWGFYPPLPLPNGPSEPAGGAHVQISSIPSFQR